MTRLSLATLAALGAAHRIMAGQNHGNQAERWGQKYKNFRWMARTNWTQRIQVIILVVGGLAENNEPYQLRCRHSLLRGPGGRGDRRRLSAGSDLRHASIDGEIHTGDVRTFIGGEERDGSRDFLWLAPATHWDLRGKLGGRLLGLFSGKARRRL